MFRFYLASAFLAFGLYGTAQYKGWSVMPSEAQEFERRRAEQQSSSWGRGGSGSGGSSGHK
jgi:uncharacterized membrane protein YgcG